MRQGSTGSSATEAAAKSAGAQAAAPREAAPAEVLGWFGARWLLLIAAQGAVVLALWGAGELEPLWASVAWWPLTLSLAQLPLLALLARRWGGVRRMVMELSRGERPSASALALFVPLALALGVAPALLIAQLLWGEAPAGRLLLVGVAPAELRFLAWSLVPLLAALVELPLLAWWLRRAPTRGAAAGLAIAIGALLFALPHLLHPFVPAMQFSLWRALMPLPLGLLFAMALHRHPALLPAAMALQALLALLAALWVYG